MVNAKTKVVDMIRTMQKQRKEGRQIFYDILYGRGEAAGPG
nr:hypothetical protein [Mediterraneibacter glycyrrhizinilyticus]